MLSLLTVALAAVSVSAHSMQVGRRHHAVARATPPPGYATGYLEDYNTYHTRYMAIGCENKHSTPFWDMCCHPMLSTETLENNRPACCAPGATAQCPGTPSSSAAAPESTSTDEEDDGEDCEDDSGDDDNTGDDDTNDDDDEDCDDEGEGEDSTSSTHVVASTTTRGFVTSTRVTTHATTSTAKASAPKTTSTHTTAKAATTSTADTSTKAVSSSSSSFITGGFGTWFTQNGVAGACGKVHKDTDYVVALPTKAYAKGANCGRKVNIVDIRSGKSVQATVADECPTCDNNECLDMSLSLFKQFETLSVGEFSIKYQFMD